MPPLTLPADVAGFSRESALYLANACDLAYADDPAGAAHDVLGLDAVTFTHLDSDTQGFVGRGDGFAVLAFRGSERINEHPKDWLTDFNAVQVRQDPFTGQVHAGFSRAVTAAWDAIDPVLRKALAAGAAVGADDPGVPLYVTGHSLGGGLATLAGSRLSSGMLDAAGDNPAVRFRPSAVYTFGAPRVGNAEFTRAFVQPPTFRVVNNLDVVPLVPLSGVEVLHGGRLPPFAPPWLRALFQRATDNPLYGDAGALIHIDNAGTFTEGGVRPDWLASYGKQALGLGSLSRSLNAPLTDHFIDSYIRALSG